MTKGTKKDEGREETEDDDEETPSMQTDLEGNVYEVQETPIVKESTLYTAGHFKVTVGDDALKRMDPKTHDKKMRWLKSKMRAMKDKDPSGEDFERDFKALFAHIFS